VAASNALAPALVGDTIKVDVFCPSGKMVTGGGGATPAVGVVLTESIPKSDLTGWAVDFLVEVGHASVTVFAEAVCADVQAP
jgi:hypothetical protein